jgi:hypothetical protein
MNTYKYHYRLRQSGDARIVVIPARPHYAEQMEHVHQAVYDYDPAVDGSSDEDLTAEKFRQHLRIFPEGQFIALDAATDRVAGLTANMRTRFDLNRPYTKSWAATTGCG